MALSIYHLAQKDKVLLRIYDLGKHFVFQFGVQRNSARTSRLDNYLGASVEQASPPSRWHRHSAESNSLAESAVATIVMDKDHDRVFSILQKAFRLKLVRLVPNRRRLDQLAVDVDLALVIDRTQVEELPLAGIVDCERLAQNAIRI